MKIHLIFLIIFMQVANTYAGSLWKITLTRDGKIENHQIHIGSTFAETEIVGYSIKLKRFVSITYPNAGKPPKPIAEFWNPSLNRKSRLFHFKESGEILIEILDPSDLKFLPNISKIDYESEGVAD